MGFQDILLMGMGFQDILLMGLGFQDILLMGFPNKIRWENGSLQDPP